VHPRAIEKLQVMVDQRQSGVDAATATKQSAFLRVSTQLPAEKARAEAEREQAQVDLDKTFVRAGVDGRVEQFLVRPGDLVAQIMRPAGILIPEEAGRNRLQAGSKPWRIIPLVITSVQDFIAAGQVRAGELLIDPQNLQTPGSILVFLEPLYDGGLEGVTRGSSCIVNAYTDNHDVIADPKTGALKGFALHAVDATGLVHALLLRIQALLLPIKTLVLSGH